MRQEGFDDWAGRVYGAKSNEELKREYDVWAADYDRDVESGRYSLPALAGIDLSPEMLARAEARGVYQELRAMDLGARLDFPDDRFAACTALGVLTPGHAPPTALDEMLRVTAAGGHLIFTV